MTFSSQLTDSETSATGVKRAVIFQPLLGIRALKMLEDTQLKTNYLS